MENNSLIDYVDSFDFGYSHLLSPVVSDEVMKMMAVQSALETRYGESNIYRENANLFGMKLPKVRPTFAVGENRNHAKYNCFADSVLDLLLWCVYNKCSQRELRDYRCYLDLLKRGGYNIAPNTYEKTLISMFNQIY